MKNETTFTTITGLILIGLFFAMLIHHSRILADPIEPAAKALEWDREPVLIHRGDSLEVIFYREI